jgi:hypothetical protein
LAYFKQRKRAKDLENNLLKYLKRFWKKGYNPTLKEVTNDLNIKNTRLLKSTLRKMRIHKMLDGSYDREGTYRIYPFKTLSFDSNIYSTPDQFL